MRAGIGSRPWVGIDLGTYSVKVVTVQGTVGGPRYRVAEIALPGTEDSPDRPLPPEVVAQAISEGLGKLGQSTRSRGIAIGVSGPDVIVKQITLPLLDESEVGPALRFEARKHLPFDPQTMVIDYQVLGRLPSERKLDILLAAVSREHLDRHLAPLTKIGIDPEIVDATPLALANAIADEADVGGDAQVLLDIGHGSSHLTIFQRGQPFFARRFDFGGRNLTRAIAADGHIPYAEAEEWKLAVGGDEPGLRVNWDAPEMQSIHECLRRQLVEELHRSFAFYRTQAQLSDVQRIWISGGSSRLPGLSQRLGEMLGIPVLLFDPLDDGNTGVARPGPQFAQAFGLTSRT